MGKLLILRNVFEDLGITRNDMCSFYDQLQHSAALQLVGWRLPGDGLNLPEVPLPDDGSFFSFYTVIPSEATPSDPSWVKKFKARPFAQTLLIEQPFAPWRIIPKLVVNRIARLLDVPRDTVSFKFIETNTRIKLHSDTVYGAQDSSLNHPGYRLIHESNQLSASINWTVRGHESPFLTKGERRLVSNEGALEFPFAFDPTVKHGTTQDVNRLTAIVRPSGLSFEQLQERLSDLVQEARV